MDKVILQVPVAKTLRRKAEKTALDYGFSSLQEAIRVFMAKLAKKTIEVSFQEVVRLSSQAEARLGKMDKDFSIGRDIYIAKTVKELKDQLSEWRFFTIKLSSNTLKSVLLLTKSFSQDFIKDSIFLLKILAIHF